MRAGRTWLRHTTSLMIVGFLVVVTVVGYQRTSRNGNEVGEVDPEEVGIDPTDIAVGLYRGFQHTETVAGKTVFVLNSIRTLSRASGWQEIEGVRLQFFYHDDDDGPVLTAENASFNIETREARLSGGIHVEFPNGAFLNTEAGRFQSRRQIFVSEAPVLYVDGATYGQAERASYDLEKDRVILEGNAALRVEDGAMLVAPRMVYRRDTSEVLFSDGIELTQGTSILTAPRGTVSLAEEDGPAQAISLSGGVQVTTIDQTGAEVHLKAPTVQTDRDPKGNWQVSARTDGPWIEVRFSGGPEYFERTLKTTVLNAVVGETGVLSMQTEQGTCFEEIPMEGPLRTAESEVARAWFDDGLLTDVELDGAVELRADNVAASATRARLIQATGLVLLQGDPSGRNRVGLVSERGTMSCDQAVLYDREDRIEARGKVQGELLDAELLSSAEAEHGEDSVRFAGEILETSPSGDRFTLRDSARIWQDRRILLADHVDYNQRERSVAARGHVRASFPADRMDKDAGEEEDVVVDARSLDYEEAIGQAIFRGSVHFADPKHALSTNRLVVNFGSEGEISDVEATGAVEILDLVNGRRLTGNHAVRHVESGTITVTGAPAQLTDARGNVASGDSLTWNQADGTVSIAGGTELIYYPEEQP